MNQLAIWGLITLYWNSTFH